MNRKQEIKYLQVMLKKLESEKESFVVTKAFRSLFMTSLVLVLLLLIYALDSGLLAGWLVVLISMLVGGGIGAVSSWQHAELQWPTLKAHINPESVKQRLDQITSHTT